MKIVLLYGKYENINKVRTEFAKFYQISHQPRQVPSYKVIKRVVERFERTGSVHITAGPGRPRSSRTEENAATRVNQLVSAKNSLSVRGIAFQLDLLQTNVWTLLRKVSNAILC